MFLGRFDVIENKIVWMTEQQQQLKRVLATVDSQYLLQWAELPFYQYNQ